MTTGRVAFVLTAGMALAACADPCEAWTVRAGSGCLPLEDGATCGDGRVEGDEACDPGATELAGCEADCQPSPGYACVDNRCSRMPPAPVVSGRDSSDPDFVTWTWTLAGDAVGARIQLDDGTPSMVRGTTVLQQALPVGRHTLAVQACDPDGICSAPVRHTTRAERFGPAAGPYRSVRRSLSTTALGHVAAVACRDCLAADDGSVRPFGEGQAALATSLSRGGDFIHAQVAQVGSQLILTSDPAADLNIAPRLRELLGDSVVAMSDAPLVLELHAGGDPGASIAALLDALEEAPEVVRNGRPAFLRLPPADSEGVVVALREALAARPLLAPYLRVWVTLPEGQGADLAGALDRLMAWGVDGVVASARTPTLFARLGMARARQLGVWVDDVPPGSEGGDTLLAGLRESVDGFLTTYRTDRARDLVGANDVIALLDAGPHASPAEPLPVGSVDGAGLVTVSSVPIGNEATIPPPKFVVGADGEPLTGGLLDFASGDRALPLVPGPVEIAGGQGVLLAAVLVLDEDALALPAGETRAIAGNLESGGFALRITSEGGRPLLEFAVQVDGELRRHRYPLAGSEGGAEGSFAEPMQAGRAYWVVGTCVPGAGVRLLIDGRLASTPPDSAAGDLTTSALPVMVGADPGEGEPPVLSSYFRGQLQVVQLLRWTTHDADGGN